MSQYTINHSNNCLNTTNSYNTNVSNNYTVAEDLSQLLAWLSPLDPGLRHSDIQERRVHNVGEWLMGADEFRRWCRLSEEGEDDKPVLFCYGNPGVGKTFISSLVVDRLCDQTRGQNTTVTCFYFDFAARKEQTAASMLGSLLKQIVSGTGGIKEDIWQALREQKEAIGGRKLQLADIVNMLQLITSSQRIFMIIDALDECTAVQRFRLFHSLKEILEKSQGGRIFVTGRPHIRAEIQTRLAGLVTTVSVGPTRNDIVRFLRVRLSEDETPEAMDESLKADILEKLPGIISEMFLLASLNIEGILQESTLYRRRERLNKMTDGLGLEDVYGATIERIKAQDGDKSRLGMGALMWISHAERPLSVDELCYALAVELGSSNFNTNNIPSSSTLVRCCQGLITVDKEASTVRLIHYTVQEYLSALPNIFDGPHSTMAEICLTYLNSEQVKAIPSYLFPDTPGTPFLQYCSVYWGVHAKRELSECSRSLALELLKEYHSHISGKLFLLENLNMNGSEFWEIAKATLSGLHCASFFGIGDLVAALIEMRCYDINEGDVCGWTPLAWAAWNGHEEVVKILLEREEVNPDKPALWSQTPLSLAAGSGHEGVVKMLLEREDVNPDKPNDWGLTPLSFAAQRGHEGVVKILLARKEVTPDKPDNEGNTPLFYATKCGYRKVIALLQPHDDTVTPSTA